MPTDAIESVCELDEAKRLIHILQAVADSVPDALFVKDLAGRFLFCNAAEVRLAGRPLDQILGQDDETLFGIEAAKTIQAQDRRVMASGIVDTREHVLVVSGRQQIYEVTKTPFRAADGSIIGVVGMAREITENRKAQEREQATNRQLSSIYQTVADIVFRLTVEPDGGYRFESVNPAFTKCTGLSADAVVGKRVEQVIPEPSLSLALENYRLAIESNQVVRWEETTTYPTAKLVGEVSIAPVFTDEGVCSHLVGSVHDITKRKHAEEALRRSETQYRQLVENAPYCIHELDSTGRFLSMNAAGLRMMEAQSESCIIGMKYLDAVAEVDRPRISGLLELAGTGVSSSFEFTAVNQRCFSSNFVPLADGRIMGITKDISERKSAEEAVRDSERRFREMADAIPQIIWVAEPDGGLTYLNAKATEYSGVVTSELTAWSWERVVHPDDLASTVRDWTETLRTGFPRDIELRLRRADGTYRWHISRQIPLRGPTGAISVWYGTCTDIEELKQAERAFRESELRFRNVLDFYPAAVFLKDLAGRYLFANRHAAEKTRIPQSAWLGKTASDLFPAETAAQFDRNDHLVFETRRPHQLEESIFLPNGQEVTLLTVQFPLFNGEEELYAICGISTDITDRKVAEEERDRLWNDSLDPLCVAGFDGQFKQVSPAWTRSLGWSEQELLSRPWLDFVHPDDRDATIRAGEHLAQGHPLTRFENRYRCKDGSYRWIAWNANSRVASQTIYASARDVTTEKQLAEQLLQSQKLEAIGRLAGGVAHDFNNLLTVINGYSELLLHNSPEMDSRREPLSAIHEAGERAARLTAQLLAFSRKSIVEPKILELNQEIESAARMLRRLIGEDVQLMTNLSPGLSHVKIDRGQFEQILINLVVNARDAMPRGGLLSIATNNTQLPVDSTTDLAPVTESSARVINWRNGHKFKGGKPCRRSAWERNRSSRNCGRRKWSWPRGRRWAKWSSSWE